MKIKLNIIKPMIVECFDYDDNSLGFANFDEFNDLRVQIHQQQVEGYYAIFNGEKIHINKFGQVINHRAGFFDLFDEHLNALLDL